MFGTLAEANFLLPTKASTMASEIDWLTMFIIWVSIISGGIVFLGTVYIAVKFRYRPGHPEKGSGSTHSTFLEIFWSVIPAIVCLLIAIWGFQGYMKYNVQPPNADLEIQVEARKWSWSFTYPNGFSDSVLHLPKDGSVRFVLSSTDVIHSLYFPQFRIKKDVVPGRYNKMWVVPTEISSVVGGSKLTPDDNYKSWTNPDNFVYDTTFDTNTKVDATDRPQDGFDIFCAEYCGTKHSKMLSKVYVHPDMANFKQWLANASDIWRKRPDGSDPKTTEVGLKLAKMNGCFGCHSVDGSKNTGPTWKNLFGEKGTFTDGGSYNADENYIRESIEYPSKHIVTGYSPAMPSFLGKIKPAEQTAIINYMKSISENYKGSTADLDLPPPELKQQAPAK